MNSDVTVTANFTSDPTLVVTPAYKNFGTKKIGQRAIATFTVKNSAAKGVADLTWEPLPSAEQTPGSLQLWQVRTAVRADH